jgi:superoxide dismutase, Cu-Zn family
MLGKSLIVIVTFIGVAVAAPKPKPVTVEMKDGAGKSVGTVKIQQQGSGVEFKLNLKGVPAGEHAFHVHHNAACEADPAKPDDAFKSAGPHFNPTAKKHGLQNPDGPHAGDMPNFTAKANGTYSGKIADPNVTLEPNAANSLYANGGTSIMVHAKPDDMKTDPAGNAGARIACGVIKR